MNVDGSYFLAPSMDLMRSSISAFLMRVQIEIVLEEVRFAFVLTTFLFHNKGTVALLYEAIAKSMEGAMDGLPIATLARAVEVLVTTFISYSVTICVVD